MSLKRLIHQTMMWWSKGDTSLLKLCKWVWFEVFACNCAAVKIHPNTAQFEINWKEENSSYKMKETKILPCAVHNMYFKNITL